MRVRSLIFFASLVVAACGAQTIRSVTLSSDSYILVERTLAEKLRHEVLHGGGFEILKQKGLPTKFEFEISASNKEFEEIPQNVLYHIKFGEIAKIYRERICQVLEAYIDARLRGFSVEYSKEVSLRNHDKIKSVEPALEAFKQFPYVLVNYLDKKSLTKIGDKETTVYHLRDKSVWLMEYTVTVNTKTGSAFVIEDRKQREGNG